MAALSTLIEKARFQGIALFVSTFGTPVTLRPACLKEPSLALLLGTVCIEKYFYDAEL